MSFEEKQKKILGTIEDLVKQLGTLKPPVERPEDTEVVYSDEGSYFFRNKTEPEVRHSVVMDAKPRQIILPETVTEKQVPKKQQSFWKQNKKFVVVSIGLIALGLVVLWLFS